MPAATPPVAPSPAKPTPKAKRQRRGLLVAGAVLAVAGLGLAWWMPSEAELAQRAGELAGRKLGVPVTVGTLQWHLLPVPGLLLGNVRTEQPQPIVLDRIGATLRTAALWRGEIELQRLEVDGASVPQASLRGLGDPNGPTAAQRFASPALPLHQLQIRNLRWVERGGRALVYEGEADFDAGWRPRSVQLRRPDAATPTSLGLARQDGADRWRAEVRVGGGVAEGEVALQIDAGGLVRLSGELKPKDIEVQAALTAFERRSPVAGKASGLTTLTAEGLKFGELARSLHTRTGFTMAPATLTRFDLDRAVRSLGKEHAGTTRLDTLSGQMDTQNTADGVVTRFTSLKAHSGVLTATGEVTLAQQRIEAQAAVDLVDGLVGVPIKVKGPVSAMQVTVPQSAVAGAAVGTAVLPGVGTAIGARIGATLGRLFGRDEPAKPSNQKSPAWASP